MRRLLIVLSAFIACLGIFAVADVYSPPTPGGTVWINPVTSFSASGLNTTGVGACATGTPTALTLKFMLNLVNGMTIDVVGAGTAGADLISTVSSGGGTLNITLGTGCGTTVTAATVKVVGTIGSASNSLALTSTAGWASGEGIVVQGVGPSQVKLDAVATSAVNGSVVTTVSNSNLTIGSGSNRCLVGEITFFKGTVSTPPSAVAMTWNGTSMTLIGSATNTTTGFTGTSYLFGLVAPASGNHALVSTWTTTQVATISGTSFVGCNQTGSTTTFANETTATGSGADSSLAVTNAAGSIAVHATTAFNGYTAGNSVQLFNDAANTGGAADYSAGVNHTFSWHQSTTGVWSSVGVSITPAATGGPLTTTVNAVGPSALTLAANTASSGTNVQVDHDDTAAINAATATGLNVWIPVGQFNVTGELEEAFTQWVQCQGAIAPYQNFGANVVNATQGGTVFWNRGTNNNVWNITAPMAHLSDCGIVQANDVIPTSGWGIQVGSGSGALFLSGGWIERNWVFNAFDGFNINFGVGGGWEIAFNQISMLAAYGPTSVGFQYNNQIASGDNYIIGNIVEGNPGQTCLNFLNADTQSWTHDKFNGCNPSINSSSASGVIQNQTFVSTSMEASFSATGPLVTLSAGNHFTFVGNEFGVDNGQGAIAISGSADFITIGPNTLASSLSGTPYKSTNGAQHVTYGPLSVNPTFTSGACVGSISSVLNGTALFKISTGTGSCGSTFTLAMPTAPNAWGCTAYDPADGAANRIINTTQSATAPVFTHWSIGTTPAAANFSTSHTITVQCTMG